MINAANQLGWGHVGCFAHMLNLLVCLPYKVDMTSGILARAHKLVGHFRRSPGAAQVLKEKQELFGLPVNKLIQDVPTRWNSAHDILSHNTLSTDEVVIAEAAVELLVPFKTTMTLMCSGTQPTTSLILQIIYILLMVNLAQSPGTSTTWTIVKRRSQMAWTHAIPLTQTHTGCCWCRPTWTQGSKHWHLCWLTRICAIYITFQPWRHNSG